MVKRTRTDIARELDRSHTDQASAKRSSRPNTHTTTDELIVWLADTYENKRARQVVEWQHGQPMYLRQSV